MRSEPVRVAVDLETTGLRPEQDAIIEIGAVKFAGERILDTFQSFVNISGPLPYRIQRLTGIMLADLRHAPPLNTLIPDLRAFIGDAPLVGHSVSFDATFLRRVGLARRNPLIDTYELASMLMPSLSSYTLGAVANALDAPSSIHHRALADADLARAVFLALMERLRGLETTTLDDLAALRAPRDWTPGYLARAQARERHEVVSASPFAALLSSVGPTGGEDFARKGMSPALGGMAVALATPAGGAGKAGAGQPEVSRAAVETPGRLATLRSFLDEGGALLYELERKEEPLVDALTEVARWVMETGERALISAANHEEMARVARELAPLAVRRAAPDGQTVNVAELDERNAYVCLHRWFGVGRDGQQGGEYSLEVARGLAKLSVWSRETLTGRRGDVSLHGAEGEAWERVRSGPEFSETTADCPYRAEGYCFVARASKRAEEAAIVVTTHAALAAQLTGADTLLPDASRTLALDGRLLEDALRKARTVTLEQPGLQAMLDTLAPMEANGARGGLFRMAATLTRADMSAQEREWLAAATSAHTAVTDFFSALRQMLRETQESAGRGSRGRRDRPEQADGGVARVDARARESHAWARVAEAWDILSDALAGVSAAAREASDALESARGRAETAALARGAQTDLLGLARRLDDLRVRAGAMIERDDDRYACWIRAPQPPMQDTNGRDHRRDSWRGPRDTNGQAARPDEIERNGGAENGEAEALEAEEAPTLTRAPAQVGGLLRPLWGQGRGLALLGWSLSVGGDCEHVRGALALPESAIQAPLTPDYRSQTLLCLPDDAPEPNSQGYQSQLESMIVALAETLGGDVVAIFPSHAMLRSTALGIRRALERSDILALAQGVDGSARQLWQTFYTQPRTVLLGAGAFWDGAEQRERPPACVVVARAPFPAQSDPVIAARADVWVDPQAQFMTPQAALKLRQALGGLAWSHTRRNAVVIFDKRLQTRGYGPTILGALPVCEQYHGSLRELPERIARWTSEQE